LEGEKAVANGPADGVRTTPLALLRTFLFPVTFPEENLMIKCTLLLPTQDNDGVSVGREVQHCLRTIIKEHGGYTNEGLVNGFYTMDDGTVARDLCHKIVVCVPEGKVEMLMEQAKVFCGMLRQESLYFEKTLGWVEFLRADADLTPEDVVIERDNDWLDAKQPGVVEEVPVERPVGRGTQTIGEAVLAEDAVLHASPPLVRDILDRVRSRGYAEVAGELAVETLRVLRGLGLQANVYRHKGTVATVVTQAQ
jgi:hypothetical protein